ncbi:MAG: DUF1385 domain-containing protein [Chloroflexi bacterium]|nr:DUF1385 domain-containing protein [Chloroflexota bacterium]
MIRGPQGMAVAVRDAQGKIVVHHEPLTGSASTRRWAKLPILRGALVLWETLILGLRALMFSANVAMAEDGVEDASQPAMPGGMMWGSMIFALGAALALFFVTPVLIVGAVDRFIGSPVVSNVVEKIIRLALILGYMIGIGFLPDIRRVFAYHGAEHKVVNAYEHGTPLVPRAVQQESTVHPRCGTTFLIVVVVVSFVVFAALGRPALELRILSRIILVPVIAGIAYELIRFAAAHYGHPLVRLLLAPGLAVQALTTREPDDTQVEVAIAAMRAVFADEAARRAALGSAATVPAEAAR